jgi:class 3 adenylate cyclase
MEIKPVSLVLADISGYTRFMKYHTLSLLHAEQIITELLESVIDVADHPLTLSKLEGDAAFFYAESGPDTVAATKAVTKQVIGFFQAFKSREGALRFRESDCACDACHRIDELKLKAILHHGEVAFKRIRQFDELAGENVILAHRLLKNSVQAKEYILMTETFYDSSGGIDGQMPESRTEECEGLGLVKVRVFYPKEDGAEHQHPAPQRIAFGDRIAVGSRLTFYAFLRSIGLKSRKTFQHLEDDRPSLWGYIKGTAASALGVLLRRKAA